MHPRLIIALALGVLAIWMGIDSYRKGKIPGSRIPASRRRNPFLFWWTVVILIGGGSAVVALTLLAEFGILFDGR